MNGIGDRTGEAIALMADYAARTGLSSSLPSRRYLWTDAFAVCNFLGLARATGDAQWRVLALRLVESVHHELGKHRVGERKGTWISGRSPQAGELHPTSGGLRIGKPLPEREADEPIDADLEWERDGQYFHYLTQWIHALDQVSRDVREPRFHQWACELAIVAHRSFACGPSGRRRMVWKRSVDLTRVLVGSMGQHDPVSGLVCCEQLEATAHTLSLPVDPALVAAKEDFASMIDPRTLPTADPLGIGGLLADATRLVQLASQPEVEVALLAAASTSLGEYARQAELSAPAHHRLAFRELGLAIGLAGLGLLGLGRHRSAHQQTSPAIARLQAHLALRETIEAFWRPAERRRTRTWLEHADINDVMLATSLSPEGFLELRMESSADVRLHR
jgi:hypothetical protein